MHVLSYTLLEDGRILPRRLWIKHRGTQASSVRDTAFDGRFYLIKSDRKFQYNTRHKLTVKWRTIEIALTWRPVPKQIGILFTWLIIMVKNCYVYFILHYTWRWIQISEKTFEINSTEHKHVRIAAPRFDVSWNEAKNRRGSDALRIKKIHK